MKEEKTNVMRLLDAKKIYYRPLDYSLSGAISGTDAADALSLRGISTAGVRRSG